jgi:succinate-semialdehyde dehydrogenase/glutarate-semialdehyde dehydrogenase
MVTTAPELQVVSDGPLAGELVARLNELVVSDGTLPPLADFAPFSGAKLADVPTSSDADVAAAYAMARDAQRRWARVPIEQRKRIILRFHDLMLARRDEALDLVQWETGKARRDALEEFLDILVTARHYARDAKRLLKPRTHRGVFPVLVGVREHHHPKGVVSIIAPWNYPLTLAISDAIPALLAGNAVVLKPDSNTPLSALWVVGVMREAGLPDGMLEVVVGSGTRLGPQMVTLGQYMMFTGSTAVGRLLAKQCGEQLKSASMELGGKNAIIICEDADLDKAAEVAVRASFSNSGQLCISMERMLVHEGIYEPFMERFLQRVRGMRLAPGVGWGADMGSLISAQQLTSVQAHVDDAIAKGATLLAGGKHRPDLGPFFYEPTVLTAVDESMALCREEPFGPVVSVYRFAHIEQAIERANDTEYGLNASIISRDIRAASQIARRLRSGTVNINEGYAAAWGTTRSTMGGMGDSGMGRRHGAEGLLKYTEQQSVAVQRMFGFGAPFGWSDERWGNILTVSVGAMKKVGLK